MRVVSVINYKGGVGKTTLTANLGADLAWRGLRVLLIDLDPQCSLTFSFVEPERWESELADEATIKSWYDATLGGTAAPLASLVYEPAAVNARLSDNSAAEPLSLIASHLGLINVDLELASGLTGATLRQSKLNYLRVHRRLLEGLQEPEFEQFDVVLIDCPPNFNIVTKTAIVASECVLVPAKADYLSTLGIDYLQRSLDELVGDYNDYAQLDAASHLPEIGPGLLGVVFTMLQHYGGRPVSAARPYISQIRGLGVPVFDQGLRENKTLFASAAADGVPVVLLDEDYRGIRGELEGFVSEFCQALGL